MQSITHKISTEVTETTVENIALQLGLVCSLKDSLKTKEDNLHWHFKKPGQKGVLELTLFFSKGETVLSFHDNRSGDWIETTMKRFGEMLQE